MTKSRKQAVIAVLLAIAIVFVSYLLEQAIGSIKPQSVDKPTKAEPVVIVPTLMRATPTPTPLPIPYGFAPIPLQPMPTAVPVALDSCQKQLYDDAVRLHIGMNLVSYDYEQYNNESRLEVVYDDGSMAGKIFQAPVTIHIRTIDYGSRDQALMQRKVNDEKAVKIMPGQVIYNHGSDLFVGTIGATDCSNQKLIVPFDFDRFGNPMNWVPMEWLTSKQTVNIVDVFVLNGRALAAKIQATGPDGQNRFFTYMSWNSSFGLWVWRQDQCREGFSDPAKYLVQLHTGKAQVNFDLGDLRVRPQFVRLDFCQ